MTCCSVRSRLRNMSRVPGTPVVTAAQERISTLKRTVTTKAKRGCVRADLALIT